MVSEITNSISFAVCIVSLCYMIRYLQYYRLLILIPFSFSLASVFYGNYPNSVTADVLYDIATVTTILVLIIKTIAAEKHCKQCKMS